MTTDVMGEEFPDDTPRERAARRATEVVLSETSQRFVDSLVDKLIVVTNELSGHKLRPYQEPFARRIFESLIIGDGAILSALFSRQSGKSETVANVVACAMIMLPRLARVYPDLLGKFAEGMKVGAFAPVNYQADILYGRIVARLTSERAEKLMGSPEINEKVHAGGTVLKLLRCGSEVRKTTAHPRASIEGQTYHLILIDECQGADNRVVDNSIMPMATETGGTKVLTGTPGYSKNVFYRVIQTNKRLETQRGRKRVNHFEADWTVVGKYSPTYLKSAQIEMLRLGEDSDDFRRQYCNQWLLEKGMFVTGLRLDQLADPTMNSLIQSYHRTPVVVGIDCGRKQDRTVVTVLFVDWDHPDQFNYYPHRVLSWLDLEGMEWESQYYRIVEYLRNYRIWKVGIDTNGLGDVVVNRLRHLMPDVDIVDLGSSPSEQSVRWKHLRELIGRGRITWPGGSKVKEMRVWKRFRMEMEDLEIEYKGPNILGQAPNEADAHDDYPDSLSMACVLTTIEEEETVEVQNNFLYTRSRR